MLLVALAVRLFDEELVSLGQAANLVGRSPEDFVERLAAARISRLHRLQFISSPT